MRKILLLKNKLQCRPSGYDHVFSFSADQADSHADDYISPLEVQSLCDIVYDCVCERLGGYEFEPLFTFHGVNLLWCFKKELFYSVYQTALELEVLRRVMRKFPDAQFYFPRGAWFLAANHSTDFLKMAGFGSRQPIQWIDVKMQNDSHSNAKQPLWAFWPSVIFMGRRRRCCTVVFSDYARSKDVIRLLAKKGCSLFSNAPSLRTIARAILSGVSLFQIDYRSSNINASKDGARFLQLLKETRLFLNTRLGEIDGEPLLQSGLEKLFALKLPRLLIEIEAMHHFFQQAGNLRSALLDEDVDPSKNAFCQIARSHHVETFVESHGALGGRPGFVPLTADKLFVWGQAQKRKVVRWKCPEDAVVVSGCSRYAHYQQLDGNEVRRKVCRDFKLDSQRKTVLLVFMPHSRWSSWYANRVQRTIGATLDAARELSERSDVQFVIKLHPAETNESYYHDWIAQTQLTGRAVVVRKYDPLMLAKAVDLLVVYGSTYAVDGFALDKPVICVDDKWDLLLEEFRPYGVFLYADTREQIVSTVAHVLREGFSRPPLWEQAKQECLNQNAKPPAAFIAEQLSHV